MDTRGGKPLYLSGLHEKTGKTQSLYRKRSECFSNVQAGTAMECIPPKRVVSRRSPKVASVEERVIDIVAEQLGVSKDQITRETSFVNDLGADSLDTVELVMELEEEFDINIPDDAAEKIQTVGQAIDHIEKAVAKQRKLPLR